LLFNPYFVKAFLEINKSNAHLLFTGNGILEKELKQLSNNHSGIHFIDFQNQSALPAYYQACDLFCLPSQGPGETWGLAINEAMACGKAVLGSDKVGCVKDMIKPGINGDIFESNNMESLKLKLSSLLNNKKLLDSYGLASKEIIKNWNFENTAQTITKELLNESQG